MAKAPQLRIEVKKSESDQANKLLRQSNKSGKAIFPAAVFFKDMNQNIIRKKPHPYRKSYFFLGLLFHMFFLSAQGT